MNLFSFSATFTMHLTFVRTIANYIIYSKNFNNIHCSRKVSVNSSVFFFIFQY